MVTGKNFALTSVSSEVNALPNTILMNNRGIIEAYDSDKSG